MGSNPTPADRFLYIRITYSACLEMRLKVELSKLIGRFCASWRKSNHFIMLPIILRHSEFNIYKDTNCRRFLIFVTLLVQTHRYFHSNGPGRTYGSRSINMDEFLLWPTHRLCPWIINYTPPCTTVF